MVQYTAIGNSLWPRVQSGDCCSYEPVISESDLTVEDTVFCELQPASRFYAHKILRIETEPAESAQAEPKRRYIIGDESGHANGWCHINHIYGILIESSYVVE